MKQPIELQVDILLIISQHEKGASTYRIFKDIEATGYKNKPRIMKYIRLLHKYRLISDNQISERRSNKQLTKDGMLLVKTKKDIDSFFKEYDSFSKIVTEKFGSVNDNVLRIRGWGSEDLRAKDLYRLRIINLIFQVGIIVNDGLLSRFGSAVMLLSDNKFAMNVLAEIVTEGLRRYYQRKSLEAIRISYPEALESTISENYAEFDHSFVPSMLTKNALSNLDKMRLNGHCSVIRNDLAKLKESLYALIEPDDLSRSLSQLQREFNKDVD